METWRSELRGDGVPEDRIQVISGGPTKRRGQLRHLKWFNICNYEMLEKYQVLDRGFQFVVYDESVRLGNMSAKVTKYTVRKYDPNVRYLALSGAPASESPIQLISQYLSIQGNFMGFTKYTDYLQGHWKYVERAWAWKPRSKKHLATIQEYNHKTGYCVTMEDLGLGSEKLYATREILPNKEQERLFKLCRELSFYRKGGKDVEFNPLTRTTFEQLVSAGMDPFNGNACISDAKIRDVLQYYLDNKEPLLILSRFKSLIQHTVDIFQKDKIPTGWITGDTPVVEREGTRGRFQSGALEVVVAQVRTVKMGLDFSRASTIFYLSNSFSQDDRAQSEDRATHLDKKDPVQIIDTCTVGSMDAVVVDLLRNKQEVSTAYIQRKLLE
jgi:SNF2 family DNA or RNA helicase